MLKQLAIGKVQVNVSGPTAMMSQSRRERKSSGRTLTRPSSERSMSTVCEIAFSAPRAARRRIYRVLRYWQDLPELETLDLYTPAAASQAPIRMLMMAQHLHV